jgi:uncharacterized protein
VLPFIDPPQYAAWQHREARNGFEVVFLGADVDGRSVGGATTAVEAENAWAIEYEITLNPDWLTRSARVVGRWASAPRRDLTLESDGAGRWRIDGQPAPHLDGCLDVDLESSALTNAFPVHRLGLQVAQEASAPAAYVRALGLSVERLDQHYRRLDDDGTRQRYWYAAPAFDFACELLYDEAGLLLDYPGIAIRAA